jgi:hypothetical protein
MVYAGCMHVSAVNASLSSLVLRRRPVLSSREN